MSVKVILGLSGGADSVALLDMLYRDKDYRVIAAHVNFHLRGDESDHDEAFVRQLVTERYPGVPLEVHHQDTIRYADREHLSIEMAAREIRYRWFEQLREQYHAERIAVAHHADDQVETILLNLSRGTGGEGLVGMQEQQGHIWRPLLGMRKSEIMDYMRKRRLPHVEDSTNRDTHIKRNSIRHELIPAFEKLNPAFCKSLLYSRGIYVEEQAVIAEAVNRFRESYLDEETHSISLADLPPHAGLYLYRLLRPHGFSRRQVDQLISTPGESGARFQGQFMIERFRRRAYMCQPQQLYERPLEADTTLPGVGRLRVGTSGAIRIADRYTPESLILRSARAEDQFGPLGMKGKHKNVFEYLKEQGIPPFYRPYCPVLVASDGTILAVLPFRVAEEARVKKGESDWHLDFAPAKSPLGALLRPRQTV